MSAVGDCGDGESSRGVRSVGSAAAFRGGRFVTCRSESAGYKPAATERGGYTEAEPPRGTRHGRAGAPPGEHGRGGRPAGAAAGRRRGFLRGGGAPPLAAA